MSVTMYTAAEAKEATDVIWANMEEEALEEIDNLIHEAITDGLYVCYVDSISKDNENYLKAIGYEVIYTDINVIISWEKGGVECEECDE